MVLFTVTAQRYKLALFVNRARNPPAVLAGTHRTYYNLLQGQVLTGCAAVAGTAGTCPVIESQIKTASREFLKNLSARMLYSKRGQDFQPFKEQSGKLSLSSRV